MMISLWNALWADESGMILSAEAALLGTVGIVGATVGLSTVSHAVDDELKEIAFAFRSLDQSFGFEGQESEFAWTAGSHYTQPPVPESHRSLREEIERQERHEQHDREEMRGRSGPPDREERAEEERGKDRGKRMKPKKEQDERPERDRRRRPRKEAAAEQVDSTWEIDRLHQSAPASSI